MTAPAVEQRAKGGKPPAIAPHLTLRTRRLLLHSQMLQERHSFITLWRELNKYLFTARGRFLTNDGRKADRRSKDSLDITALLSARTLAAGMISGITSPAREWFRLSTPDPDLAEFGAVKNWLHQVTQRMRTVFLKSNTYRALHVMYGDMGGYGTAPIIVDEDDRSVIRCYPMPVGSYCLATDSALRVNTFSREYPMTVRQLVERYGFENCSITVQGQWRNGNTEGWHDVVHMILPNEDADVSKFSAKDKPWSSCYFEKGANEENKFLLESGYDEWPLLVGRWETTAEDAYATQCPGITALDDIKQLQHGEKRALQMLDKATNPPLVSPSDLRNAAISQLPGGVTFSDAPDKQGLRPLHEVRPDFQALEFKQSQKRELIRQAFFADLFRMNSYLDEKKSKQPVTAAEIGERREEKLLQLGAVLENLNEDVLHPLIDRTYAIMLRRGHIPTAPPELEGVELKVEYLSIMHAAQKSGGLGSLERFAMFGVQIAAGTKDPTVMDKINTDEMMEEFADMAGVAPQTVRSDEAVAAIRQQRQEAQQQAERAKAMRDEAAAARDLSESDTTGENALTDLLSAAGAGGAQAEGEPV